jgi:L-asparaginase II
VPPEPLVQFTRGSIVESVHYGSVAVVDSGGRLVAWAGEPERVTTLRSAAKPFQAMAAIEAGAAARISMTSSEIAIVAGSHSGEPRHVQTVSSMLARAGLAVEDLQTGTHPPFHEPTRAALERAGQAPTPLHHNCSGKHCGMLCACVSRNWDARTYFRPDHPLQRQSLRLLAEMADFPEREIAVGIDGCGVPSFALPLRAFARAFASLAAAPPSHDEAGRLVREAMLSHPEMVAGERRFDTDLIQTAERRLVAKGGAEGCHGTTVLERQWGVAVKIEDGGPRAVAIVVVEALRQIGALTAEHIGTLGRHARPPVRNYRDEFVGMARPIFDLRTASTGM